VIVSTAVDAVQALGTPGSVPDSFLYPTFRKKREKVGHPLTSQKNPTAKSDYVLFAFGSLLLSKTHLLLREKVGHPPKPSGKRGRAA